MLPKSSTLILIKLSLMMWLFFCEDQVASADNSKDYNTNDSDKEYEFEWNGGNRIIMVIKSNDMSKAAAVADLGPNEESLSLVAFCFKTYPI